MHSELAHHSEKALLEAAKRLSPEQRLNAFLAHSELMTQLYREGEKLRRQGRPVKKST